MKIAITIPNARKIQDAMKRYPERMSAEMAKAIRDATLTAERNIVKEAPAKTGNLRGRIMNRILPTRGEVYTTVKYAQAVHEGTRAHVIRPKNKKSLRFKGRDGKFVFAKSVNHPGTKANPFFVRGIKMSIPQIRTFFRSAVRRAVNPKS